MPTITSNHDGALLYYRRYWPSRSASTFQPVQKDHVLRPTLVFTAAWPFSSKMYDHLILPLCESYTYPCILVDRRGFGRSEWSGTKQSIIDYNTFAVDLSQILSHCEVESFIGIGASLGCGEFLMTLAKDLLLLSACKGLIFLGPSLPIPMQTERKAAGPPRSFWDELLQSLREDRYKRLTEALPYIWGQKGNEMLSDAEQNRYESMAFEADPVGLERTVQIFLSNDFTDMLMQSGGMYQFPVLILHGDADAANPVEAGPGFVQKHLPNVEILRYSDAAHGIVATHKEQCLKDITRFLNSVGHI